MERPMTVQALAKRYWMAPVQREAMKGGIERQQRDLRTPIDSIASSDPVAVSAQLEAHGLDFAEGVADPQVARESLQLDLETWKAGTPPEYSPIEKNKLLTMFREMSARFQEGRLSTDQMQQAHNESHVTAVLKHNEDRGWMGQVLLNLQRVFDPDDDRFSLEVLRPQNPVRVDMAAYWKGWDHLRFTDTETRWAASGEIDERAYDAFLRLRGRNILTPALIMRETGMNKAQFEACNDRLAAELRYNETADTADISPVTFVSDSSPEAFTPEQAIILTQYGDAAIGALDRTKEEGLDNLGLSTALGCDVDDASCILAGLAAGGLAVQKPGQREFVLLSRAPAMFDHAPEVMDDSSSLGLGILEPLAEDREAVSVVERVAQIFTQEPPEEDGSISLSVEEVLQRLEASGFVMPGTDPRGNLATRLRQSKRFRIEKGRFFLLS